MLSIVPPLGIERVQGCLASCIDLVAMEAYHTSCFSRFTLHKEMGAISTVRTQGRPINPAMQNGSRSYASGLNQ